MSGVFISFTSADREIKDQLHAILREELGPDENIWDSDRNCASNYSEECIDAIRQSEVAVIIVSEAAMKLTHVLNELIEARHCEQKGKLNIVVYQLTDSEYSKDFTFHLNHISDANHVARLQGSNESMRTVAARIKFLLAKRRSGHPELPNEVFEPEIKAPALQSTGYFVSESRNDTFEQFDQAFEKSNILFVTHINGYGRKCACKKYASLHRKDYKKIQMFHQFSGTLREFFTAGLIISNINDGIFEDLNEEEIILKKAELLGKLDEHTLLIVPNVTISDRDDAFIMDILHGLNCRVMFIAQNVPVRIKKHFPVISVGRMENKYLKELFFYHYDNADEEEQAELEETLTQFFDGIDGHTGSIEKTASLLAEERVYPDEIPDIFENIHLDSENELGDRIFTFISEMFEMAQFNEQEKQLLCLASLTAVIPMDEKQFVNLAKSCNCYDSKAFQKLLEQNWMESIREHRLVSIESFMSGVCLAKMPPSSEIIGKCFAFLYNMMLDCVIQMRGGSLLPLAKRLENFFSHLKMDSASELMSCFLSILTSGTNTHTRSSFDRICAQSAREAAQQDQLFKETMKDLIELIDLEFTALSAINNTSHRELGTDLQEEVLKAFMGNLSSLYDLIEEIASKIENPSLARLIESFFETSLTGNTRKVFSDYIHLTQEICTSDEMILRDDLFLYILEILGYKLICITKNNPYICLKLCRARLRLLDITGSINSYSEAYTIYFCYYTSLLQMAEFTEEFDYAYDCTLYYWNKAAKDAFSSEEDAIETKAYLISTYVEVLSRTDVQRAQAAYEDIRPIQYRNGGSATYQVKMIQKITESYIRDGETALALSFLTDELSPELSSCLRFHSGTEGVSDASDTFDFLTEIQNILENPDVSTGFCDRSDEYQNYYQTYPKEWSEKHLMKKYIPIAEKAKAASYASISQEEMLLIAGDLKKRASRRERWELLAPEAFALVSEAGFRVLGYRHHYVQYLGGAALADGKIAEIQNGEGKTYTIILAAFLYSLYGKQVHIMDSSPYLAHRNYNWMRGVLEYLGCSVGLMDEHASVTDEKMRILNQHDVIYETETAPFVRLRYELGDISRPPRHDVLIADEADHLLISECNTPVYLTTKGGTKNNLLIYHEAYSILSRLTPYDDEMFEQEGNYVTLKPAIYELIDEVIGRPFSTLPQQEANLLSEALRMGIWVTFFAENGHDYYIIDNTAKEENTYNGTLQDCSEIKRFFIGKKEKNESIVLSCQGIVRGKANYCTIHEYVRQFTQICGTTATASSMRKEFDTFYKLSVVCIPTNVPIVREDYNPLVFVNADAKYRHIVSLVSEKHTAGQPVLIIAGSSPESESISRYLHHAGIKHSLLNVKNINDEASFLGTAGLLGAVTVTNALANRGVDIRLGGNPEELAKQHLNRAGFSDAAIHTALANPKGIGGTSGEIQEKYESLTALYKVQTDKEKKQVEALGGLCVIGTTCFDDLRTEQQVRGRSGRQGGIGESHIFYSLQDKSLRILLGDKLDGFSQLFDSVADLPMEYAILNKAITKARLRTQKALFDRLFSAPELTLYPGAKESILGLIHKLRKGETDMEQMIMEYFIQSERNIADITAMARGGKPRVSSPVPVIYPFIKDSLSVTNRNSAIRALNKGYMAYWEIAPQKMTEKVFSDIMSFTLRTAWTKYLLAMEQEIPNARKTFSLLKQQKNLNQHLREFSQNQCRLLIEDAVSDFFRARLQPK